MGCFKVDGWWSGFITSPDGGQLDGWFSFSQLVDFLGSKCEFCRGCRFITWGCLVNPYWKEWDLEATRAQLLLARSLEHQPYHLPFCHVFCCGWNFIFSGNICNFFWIPEPGQLQFHEKTHVELRVKKLVTAAFLSGKSIKCFHLFSIPNADAPP